MTLAYVITTIQPPTEGVQSIAREALKQSAVLLVIGDRKSPEDWDCQGARYLSLESQKDLDFTLAQHLPENSYARKMLGYLLAAQEGVRWIRETDDDNSPYRDFFAEVPHTITCSAIESPDQWVNVYRYFTKRHIWPRGLPLTVVNASQSSSSTLTEVDVHHPFILQSVADGDPDVDAIYRLTASNTSDVTFDSRDPVVLLPGVWSPFNSQATTWPREFFALMYLPVTCTFRMTDIWRSFVVQRLLPGLDGSLVFTSATVHQSRNEHDLLADFGQEVPGYLGAEKIREILDETAISGGMHHLLADLETLYGALVKYDFLLPEELTILRAWLTDVRDLGLGN